jgi:aspartyl-tRNA(Asn)/glutamyl-tRNA(Gln) amidotransferase subunit B
MIDNPATVDEIIEEKGLKQVTDSGEIKKLVEEVIDNNPEQVQQFKNGKEQVIGYLVGQAMQLSKGKANPGQVNTLLRDKMK